MDQLTRKGILTKKTALEIGKLMILQGPEDTSGLIFSYSPELNSASLSHFQVLSRLDAEEKLFVLFTPLTGRKHQLRLHSAFLLGAPVVGDHRYGYPQNDGILSSTRTVDRVYKDGYALHCCRIASPEGNSLVFDVCAKFPEDRWGEIWSSVKDMTEREGFFGEICKISKGAGELFAVDEVQEFLKDPKTWAKGIRGPLLKHEIL
jgi:hypothetical protein